MGLDATFMPWVQGSMGTILIIYIIAKEIARVTPWTGDDRIVDAIGGAIGALRGQFGKGKSVGTVSDFPKEEEGTAGKPY